ncbi:hypothetical protein [Paenibacillus turpanensis]|uniref:hypothetical protein n=1 Tax=Paenibacillus turpanensis TaxID=2689078 RepID=UPI00140D12BA|nr:hypothetical protein [Paenibacillus turpanensis]
MADQVCWAADGWWRIRVYSSGDGFGGASVYARAAGWCVGASEDARAAMGLVAHPSIIERPGWFGGAFEDARATSWFVGAPEYTRAAALVVMVYAYSASAVGGVDSCA